MSAYASALASPSFDAHRMPEYGRCQGDKSTIGVLSLGFAMTM